MEVNLVRNKQFALDEHRYVTLEHRRSRLRPDARYGRRLTYRWYAAPVLNNKKMTQFLQVLDILRASAALPLEV